MTQDVGVNMRQFRRYFTNPRQDAIKGFDAQRPTFVASMRYQQKRMFFCRRWSHLRDAVGVHIFLECEDKILESPLVL